MKLDEIDCVIIEFLVKDSQISFRKIAREMGLSADTIMKRYRRLEKEGVIQPTLQIDLSKIGYEGYVFFDILVSSKNERRTVTENVAKIPDIVAVMETTGECDLMVIAAVRNITHTFDVGDEIYRINGVRRVSINNFGIPNKKEPNRFPPPVWNNLDISKVREP